MLKTQIKKQIIKLHQKKHRYESMEFIVEGLKGVFDAINDANTLVVIVEGSMRDEEKISEIIRLAYKKDIPVEFCSRNDIVDIKSTETFPGIMAIVEMPEYSISDLINNKPIIFLDNIKDPGNLGTIIRTADWFGIPNILISKESVDPYNEKTVRSTMGSIFRTTILKADNALAQIDSLKKDGYRFNAFSLGGIELLKLKKDKKVIYGFGSESHGIRSEVQEIADCIYTIHGKGRAESLNLGVAVGIVLSQI